MGKSVAKVTNSFDYISNTKEGVIDYFEMVDFEVNASLEEKKAKKFGGMSRSARIFKYDREIMPFLKNFDAEKFMDDFAKRPESERLEFLNLPQNGKAIGTMCFIALHSEQLIADMKFLSEQELIRVKKENKLIEEENEARKNEEGFVPREKEETRFKMPEGVEDAIRFQAQMYKPVFETLHCISDAQKYSNLNPSANKNGGINSIAFENGKKAKDAIKYLSQQKKARDLETDKSFNEVEKNLAGDKAAFEKKHLTDIYAKLKETDPAYVLNNSKEFNQMRDFLKSFAQNYDKLNDVQRKTAAKELSKLTNAYIKPRQEKYNDEEMNPRSKARFEIAEKLSSLCDICKSELTAAPEYAKRGVSAAKEQSAAKVQAMAK